MGTAPDRSRLPEERLATFTEAVGPSCDRGHRQRHFPGVYCFQFKRLRCPGVRPPSLSPIRRRGRCSFGSATAGSRLLRNAIRPHLPPLRAACVLDVAGLRLRAQAARSDDIWNRLAFLATPRARGRRPARRVEFEQLTTSAGSLRPSHRRAPRWTGPPLPADHLRIRPGFAQRIRSSACRTAFRPLSRRGHPPEGWVVRAAATQDWGGRRTRPRGRVARTANVPGPGSQSARSRSARPQGSGRRLRLPGA